MTILTESIQAPMAVSRLFGKANVACLNPLLAVVASRVGTVDDDARISRVIENPEVMRRF
jgi:hypothetical protein